MGYRLRTWNRSSCSNPSSSYQQVVEWRKDAACLGHPVEHWFPESREFDDQELAMRICNGCPVQTECLEYSLLHEQDGIWGGMNQTDRQKLRKQRRLRIRVPNGEPRANHPNCGTNAGYVSLLRYNKSNPDDQKNMCRHCLLAHQLYNEIKHRVPTERRKKSSSKRVFVADKSEWINQNNF